MASIRGILARRRLVYLLLLRRSWPYRRRYYSLERGGDNNASGCHPTVVVAFFGLKVPDQLSPASEELPVWMKKVVRIFVLGLTSSAYKCRPGGTNEFLRSIVSDGISSP